MNGRCGHDIPYDLIERKIRRSIARTRPELGDLDQENQVETCMAAIKDLVNKVQALYDVDSQRLGAKLGEVYVDYDRDQAELKSSLKHRGVLYPARTYVGVCMREMAEYVFRQARTRLKSLSEPGA